MIGVPPPIGVAVRVYGPVIPDTDGDTVTLIPAGPKMVESIAGAPSSGVTTVSPGDGSVGLPVARIVPLTVQV